MDDDQLMLKVDELARKVAAAVGQTLTPFQRREVWRTCHQMIRHEGWGVEIAVAYEVKRRLRITEESPWARA